MLPQPTYSNPVHRGFFPDPSVVRVGEDYYLANSTFQYWPAVVISHSRDLVHWRVIGHAVTRSEDLDLSDLADSHGIWAPDLSYHEGVFSLYATLRLNNPPGDLEARTVPLRRQFLVTATDPAGPWSRPTFLEVDNIDPSLFRDVDGTPYLVIAPGVTLVRLSPDGTRVVAEPVQVWPGTGERAPEGPHLLHKDGWYYALLAEGGTGHGHGITVARSKTLLGPYEPCPRNPVLRQTDPAGAIQRSGHGKFVQTPAGDWWVLYLCGRDNGGPFTTLGRETALDPVAWVDGWPVVNRGRGPSATQTAPALALHPWPRRSRDEFEGPGLGLDWQFVRNDDPSGWSLTQRPGYLRLYPGDHDLDTIRARNTLVRRETEHHYTATTRLEFDPDPGQEAGLTCYYGVRNYLKLGLVRAAQGDGLWVRLTENRNGAVSVRGQLPWRGTGIELRVVVHGQTREFSARGDGPWTTVGIATDCTFLSDEGVIEGKHHTGTMVGLYAYGLGRGVADFDWFDYGC